MATNIHAGRGQSIASSAQRTIFNSSADLVDTVKAYPMKRGFAFGTIIVVALLAFELFNYSTTDFALTNLIGDLKFAGVRWGMILALAFCGIDFAGIARLFTPGHEQSETQTEVWYLLAAWFLAATMNAMLTWWGVSLALLSHPNLGNEILSRDELIASVPVFVAVLVWLIRVLLIGAFTMGGDRLFSQAKTKPRVAAPKPGNPVEPQARPAIPEERPYPRPAAAPIAPRPIRPVPKPGQAAPSEIRASAARQDDIRR